MTTGLRPRNAILLIGQSKTYVVWGVRGGLVAVIARATGQRLDIMESRWQSARGGRSAPFDDGTLDDICRAATSLCHGALSLNNTGKENQDVA